MLKYCLLSIVIKMSRNWFSKVLVVITILALVVIFSKSYTAETDNTANLKVWFINVGQGDSELIDTPTDQHILIDGGPDESIVTKVNSILGSNDNYIDLVVLSHYHSDHLTGLNEILAHYNVGEIWTSGAIYDSATYRKFVELAKSKNIKVTNVIAASYRDFGQVHGTVLAPIASYEGKNITDAHEAMVVTEWQYGTQKILFTGDMESDLEQSLINRGSLSKVDILKVGHHGSSTSSSQNFLNLVKPTFAVIEVGKDNKYGHPTDSTVQKLKAIGATILRTDQVGTIKFSLDGTNISYQTGQ